MINKYYMVFKKKKTDEGWSVKKQFARNRLTTETFATIELAEDYIRSTYKPKASYDRPWIDHKIEGSSGHLMKLEDWKIECEEGGFIDYDGYGTLVTADYKLMETGTRPSEHTHKKRKYPAEAKYILWYNR